MKSLIKLISLAVLSSLILSLFLLMVPLAQQQTSPIRINLLANKAEYVPGEPIKMQITATNATGQSVITRKGFSKQPFHLRITFTDPDGQVITTKYPFPSDEPGPPLRFADKDSALAEIFEEALVVIDDARAYYDLPKSGRYTAQVAAALETFSASQLDPVNANMFAYLEDRVFSDVIYSPMTSFTKSPATPVVKSSIEVKVSLLKIGTGTKPPTIKAPLPGVPVHLIRRSSIPADYYPINFKTYEAIYQNVQPLRSIETGPDGTARFNNVDKADYVVIVYYDRSPDFKHMGSPIDASDPDWASGNPIEKNLMVMEKANGKQTPGKTTKVKGSLLLITEPEYVEWDINHELYPFVFETIGDWTVTTSVNPPEGFAADYRSLSANVNSKLESVQFTITDTGSHWEETEVTHKIKHKGHTETIKSKIGVKLSKKLAHEKGLGIYGQTETPVFKGGKKVGQKQNK
jgi:hypothetical protein